METWHSDSELSGFVARRLPTAAGAAVLIRPQQLPSTRRAVLYLHGFADYFFQRHLADWFSAQGYAFYALDLPGHGRALGETPYPSWYTDLARFDAAVTAAAALIDAEMAQPWLLLNGHSTGGLIAAYYAARQPARAPQALFLNSPFFDLNIDRLSRAALPLLLQLARIAPALPVGALGDAYGRSLAASQRGEWPYNLQWKPLAGFPMRAASLRAIVAAQRAVRAGCDIRLPILVAHAARSAGRRASPAEQDRADIVLDVAHMRRDALRLGNDVTLAAVNDARHDLLLSAAPAREEVFQLLAAWLARVAPR
jgi:alpha-beta hydrolase superfamily lysophospholipase